MLNSIAEQELRTPCVIQLFSQKYLQGESKGQINRSQWVFSEDDDDDDNDDDDNDDNNDNDEDGDENVKSVYSQSDMSGKCCWDVYSSARYVLKYITNKRSLEKI